MNNYVSDLAFYIIFLPHFIGQKDYIIFDKQNMSSSVVFELFVKMFKSNHCAKKFKKNPTKVVVVFLL